MSKHLDRLIEHDIDTLNNHLPERRIPLNELLKAAVPQFVTRGKETSAFRKEELEWLAEFIPKEYHDDICLPIVVLRRMDYGEGIHTLAGNKVELFLIHKVLGYVDLQWTELASWKPVETLARPQVQILRSKMPSTTSVGIVLVRTREKKGDEE